MNEFIGPASVCIARIDERRPGCWHVARDCMVGLTLALVCQSALAQAMYRIKPIGGLPGGCTCEEPVATGFNGVGQVTGIASNANGDAHAFLWKNDGTPM